jgi:hypothetical protein
MAITQIQGKGAASTSLAFTSGNTAGNLLVVIGEANSALSVSDSQGNTWGTAVKIEDPSSTFLYIWYAKNCKAGANTVTVSGATNLVIAEYAGADVSSPVDVSSTNIVASSSTTQTSGSAATTAAGDLVIGAIDDGNGILPTPGTGFTSIGNVLTMSTIYKIQATVGAAAATWTTSSGIAYDAVMATFKAAPTGWKYSRAITIAHSKVANSDQTDFPVLVEGTYNFLSLLANGGKLETGHDFAFFSNSGLTSALDYEIESLDTSTGVASFWVRIPTLSHTADTVIYLAYGDASKTTDQSNKNAVWANYAGVYHFGSSAGALTANDSTSNARNGVVTGATVGTGQLGDVAGFFNSTNGDHIQISGLMGTSPDVTIEAWVSLTATGTGGAEVLSIGDNVALRLDTGTVMAGFFHSGGAWNNLQSTAHLKGTGWHHVAYSVTPGAQALYLDGVSVATDVNSGSINYSGDGSDTFFAVHGSGQTAFNFGGLISDARVSSVVRSADWIATQYNSQTDPASFYAVGAEISGATPQTITASGIASLEAFGSVTFSTTVLKALTGVASGEVFGSISVSANRVISLTGIATVQAFGNTAVSTAVSITPGAISSTEAFGLVTLGGSVSIDVGPGIPTSEAFGAVSLSTDLDQTIVISGIHSEESFGSAPILSTAAVLVLEGIDSVESFGQVTLSAGNVAIQVAGIPSASAFGHVTVKIDSSQRIPTIIWSYPAPIETGTALVPQQLGARCDDVTGTFRYNPPIGTILAPGLQRLSVAFTPDSPRWTTAFAEVFIQVGQSDAQAPAKTFPISFKYRRLDSDGDYVVTGHTGDFHINTPAAVAQACRTRLLLFAGEYWLDTSVGVPWSTEILGVGRTAYDTIIRETIIATPGVTAITAYSSSVGAARRALTISATINTLYGGQVSLSIPIAPSNSAPRNLADVTPATAPVPSVTMRIRKMDENGDFVFTGHRQDYFVNSAAGVAQAVMTRLRLWLGEWHLDTSEGTPWLTSVLGKNPQVYDAVLKDRILSSPGVTGITAYSSSLDVGNRSLSVTVSIGTRYGPITLTAAL